MSRLVMLPLQYGRTWLAIGWLLVALTLIGSLLPPSALPSIGVNDKVQHGFAYLLMTVWFAGLYPAGRYPLIAAGLFALGVGIEWLQGLMMQGREKAIDDVLANTIGICLGCAIALVWLGGWALRVERRLTRGMAAE